MKFNLMTPQASLLTSVELFSLLLPSPSPSCPKIKQSILALAMSTYVLLSLLDWQPESQGRMSLLSLFLPHCLPLSSLPELRRHCQHHENNNHRSPSFMVTMFLTMGIIHLDNLGWTKLNMVQHLSTQNSAKSNYCKVY